MTHLANKEKSFCGKIGKHSTSIYNCDCLKCMYIWLEEYKKSCWSNPNDGITTISEHIKAIKRNIYNTNFKDIFK